MFDNMQWETYGTPRTTSSKYKKFYDKSVVIVYPDGNVAFTPTSYRQLGMPKYISCHISKNSPNWIGFMSAAENEGFKVQLSKKGGMARLSCISFAKDKLSPPANVIRVLPCQVIGSALAIDTSRTPIETFASRKNK